MAELINYSETASGPRLAAHVECFWARRKSPEPARVLPDTCLDIVFSREIGLHLVGSMTRALVIENPTASFVGARLRAGAARALLGFPIHHLCDRTIALDDLRRNPVLALKQRLLNARSTHEAIRILRSVFTPVDRLSPVQKAIGNLAANGGSVRLDDMARATGLGLRQFRRRCIEETGLSPKHLARIGRFRRACSHMNQRTEIDWADLALEFGYYDQAHFINEFRALSGLTPAAYQRELANRTVFSNTTLAS